MAEVSGPGQFSKRTDKAVGEANRNLPNAGYGEQAAYQEQMAGGAMSAAPSSPSLDVTGMDFNTLFGNPASRVTPLGAETERPDEPITAGVNAGPGPGAPDPGPDASTDRLKAYMHVLEWMANRPGSSDAARNLIRSLQSNM